jgi:hypothetical protein
MSDLKNAALYYAGLGWKVFPLKPADKIPLTSHGVKDATTDAAQIEAWWTQWPNANIGFACGGENGIHVIDVDVDIAKGIDGWKTINELVALGKTFPKTVCQNTPRGGAHYFYRSDVKPKNKNSFMHGVDIRSEGYYVLLPPSVHPNGGQYKWAENLTPWQQSYGEYPDFMRPVEPAPTAFTQPVAVPVAQPGNDVHRRAKLYLATCAPAVQGLAGHGKLLWAASAMVNGLRLSDDEAFKALSNYYNPICSPPWDLSNPKDLKDFIRKITEARKNPPRDKVIGWLLDDPTYAPVELLPGIEGGIRQMLWYQEQQTQAPAPHVDMRVERGKRAAELEFLSQPTGLLGEICAWVNLTAIRPQPFLTLACVLTFCGTLFGRKIRDYLDARTNVYCMGIADSSSGKNHAPKQIRRLCEAAGCTDLLGGDDVASDSAVEKTLSEHPATLYLWDEIGHMITAMKHGSNSHKAGVVTLLMKLYSSACTVYKSKEYSTQEQRTIQQPCCCLYGMSTPDRFAEGIDPAELRDGWLGRCLVFLTKGKRPKKERNCAYISVPDSIIQAVIAWQNRVISAGPVDKLSSYATFVNGEVISATPKQMDVPADPDAEQLFIAFDEEAAKAGEKEPAMDCLWAKAEENARKIALIVAASENYKEPRVTFGVADYSIRLMRFLLNDFSNLVLPNITSSQIEKDKLAILRVIESGGVRGLSGNEIARSARRFKKQQRDQLYEDLIEAGEIIRAITPCTRGFRVWTTENYNAYTSQQQDE